MFGTGYEKTLKTNFFKYFIYAENNGSLER